MPVVSLFTGAGGLDWGFAKNEMFEVIFSNDVNKYPSLTYERNKAEIMGKRIAYRHTYLVNDIRDVDVEKLVSLRPKCVIGGPPCQDFSVVRGRTGEGINVPRGRLYAYFVKALIKLNPLLFVFENVPGIASQDNGKTIRIIKNDFMNLSGQIESFEETNSGAMNNSPEGYEILFDGKLNAVDFGVAQKRRRYIIIGARKDIESQLGKDLVGIKNNIQDEFNKYSIFTKYPMTTIEVFNGKTIPELEREFDVLREEWSEVPMNWIGTGSIIEEYIKLNSISDPNSHELNQAWKYHRKVLKELGYFNRNVSEIEFEDGSNIHRNETTRVIERMALIPPGFNYKVVDGTKYHVNGHEISMVYRRIHPLLPSYTILARGGGGTHGYHYSRKRSSLTNRERARLQSFPDNFQIVGSPREQLLQIGESVPPLLSKAIATSIQMALEDNL